MVPEVELAVLRHEVFARDVIAPAIWPASVDLGVEAFQCSDPVPLEQAVAARYTPVELGWRWGPAWTTAWFHVTGRVPEDMAGRTVALRFSSGTEATLWADGTPRRGFDRNRDDVVLFDPAHGAEVVDLHVEAACNHPFGIMAFDWDPPEVRHRWHGDTPGVLERCELAVYDDIVWRLWVTWDFVRRLVKELPDDTLATRRLLAALDESHRLIDDRNVAAAAEEATSRLEAALAGSAGATTTCLAVGHAHIDTAWLWPLRETRRKCLRSFSNVLELMQRDPAFRFMCSQTQQYAWVEADAPRLFEQITERVREGRWEATGAMWVEPDCNVPSGESLVRQILHGTRWWADRFGGDASQRLLYLPDTFGFPAALPQIMAGAGLDTFVTNKLSWCQVNDFPYTTFRWRGLDGTEVLAHCTPGHDYNATNLPHELARGERNAARQDQARTELWLQPFGFGDGGGGPTADMIRRARLAAAAPGLPAVRLAGSADFCDALHRTASDVPVWDGELYLELHRGTYTTHGRLKRANRRAEQQLRLAEILQAGGQTPMDTPVSLDATWKLVLLNQFHDILPGSSIGVVYDDAYAQHDEIAATTQQAIDQALEGWSADAGTEGLQSPMLVVNPSSAPRGGVVECDGTLHHVSEVPAIGMRVVDRAAESKGIVEVTDRTLDNGVIRVGLDDEGRIIELRRHADERHVGAGPMNQLMLYEDRPRQWEAWDIDAEYADKGWPLEGPAELRITRADPLRGIIEVSRDFITQQYVLDAGSPRVDITTLVSWSQDHRLLRALFPVNVRASHATYEIQYGHVERSTHRNTSWEKARFEVCAHRWMNLQEPGLGVALLNDGKYGHSCDGNVMGLSLLRGARTPDPTADVGDHEFTYSLMPHGGDWREAGVDHEAETLNTPLLARALPPGRSGLDRWSPVSITTEGAVGITVSALKPAQDDDRIVLRLVETRGARGRVTVQFNFEHGRIAETDLLEREHGASWDDGPATLDLRPFQIVTLVTRRTGSHS